MQLSNKNATPQTKIDYNQIMENQLKEIKATNGGKPSLLLHACCAPCSSYVIQKLAEFFEITIYFYNPNIHPKEEYSRRLKELEQFLNKFPLATGIQLETTVYQPQDFFDATNVDQEPALKTETERGERCSRCYKLRMQRAYDFALKNKFDYFTTTLSISPHKDAKKINLIGKELEQVATECKSNNSIVPSYLFADFKKKNGFKKSLELSKEFGLYRQDYCGCIFSNIDFNI